MAASEKLNFRATPPLDAYLAARALPGQTLGSVAASTVHRHSATMAAELREIQLTNQDFAGLLEVLHGLKLPDHSFGDPRGVLVTEAEDLVDDAGAPAYPGLVERLADLTQGQAAALLDGHTQLQVAMSTDADADPVALARQVGFKILG